MTALSTALDDATQRTQSPRRAWTAVLLLALVGTLNYIDRFLPAVLAEPIRLELALSDTAIGVINGFGFLVVYAVVGIAIARIADRGAFGLVISTSLTLWGAMTMLGGAVVSGFQLALTRVGVAIGEAGSTPAAHAYVARNFAPERRAAPLAVITLSIPLAGAASLMAGGLLAESFGWRTTFVMMGAISVLFAPLVLLVLGKRQAMPAATPGQNGHFRGAWELLKKPSYLAIVCAAACIAVAGYSVTTFAPAFLIRVHGMSLGEVGVQYGIAAAVTGILGLLLVGRLADRPVGQGSSVAAMADDADDRCGGSVFVAGVCCRKQSACGVVHRVELHRRGRVHGAVRRGDCSGWHTPRNAPRCVGGVSVLLRLLRSRSGRS